jgi:hypothetical protein
MSQQCLRCEWQRIPLKTMLFFHNSAEQYRLGQEFGCAYMVGFTVLSAVVCLKIKKEPRRKINSQPLSVPN